MIRPVAAFVALLMLATTLSCVPRERGETATVDSGRSGQHTSMPELPTQGATQAQFVQAIDFDLTNRPESQNYWSLSGTEAQCASGQIVDGVGAERLTELGFRPGTPGAGLPDMAFTAEERQVVADSFDDCVDMEEFIAAMFFGDGRISSRSATCMAAILDKAGVIPEFFEAWLYARPVDPFTEGVPLAQRMSAAAEVCLDPGDLRWPMLKSPLAEVPVIDVGAPAGSANSNRPDDRRDTDTVTTGGEEGQ